MPTERRNTAGAKPPRKPSHSRERKPTITIIGAGRLGTALALALDERGYSIEAIMSRRPAHARRASALLSNRAQALSAKELDALPLSSIFFITTPDDELESVAARLASHLVKRGGTSRGPVALHCSGALSSEVLSALREAGLRTGSMHPLVSISDDAVRGARSLRTAFYCIEGEARVVRMARVLVHDLGGESFSIRRRDKALYHAAAVMASGHMVALFDLAAEMLTHCGLGPRRARAVLLPLVRSTLENLAKRDPSSALTGTFARADAATAKRHLDALGRLKTKDALAVYKLLGRRSLMLAEKAGVESEALKEIKKLTG